MFFLPYSASFTKWSVWLDWLCGGSVFVPQDTKVWDMSEDRLFVGSGPTSSSFRHGSEFLLTAGFTKSAEFSEIGSAAACCAKGLLSKSDMVTCSHLACHMYSQTDVRVKKFTFW